MLPTKSDRLADGPPRLDGPVSVNSDNGTTAASTAQHQVTNEPLASRNLSQVITSDEEAAAERNDAECTDNQVALPGSPVYSPRSSVEDIELQKRDNRDGVGAASPSTKHRDGEKDPSSDTALRTVTVEQEQGGEEQTFAKAGAPLPDIPEQTIWDKLSPARILGISQMRWEAISWMGGLLVESFGDIWLVVNLPSGEKCCDRAPSNVQSAFGLGIASAVFGGIGAVIMGRMLHQNKWERVDPFTASCAGWLNVIAVLCEFMMVLQVTSGVLVTGTDVVVSMISAWVSLCCLLYRLKHMAKEWGCWHEDWQCGRNCRHVMLVFFAEVCIVGEILFSFALAMALSVNISPSKRCFYFHDDGYPVTTIDQWTECKNLAGVEQQIYNITGVSNGFGKLAVCASAYASSCQRGCVWIP